MELILRASLSPGYHLNKLNVLQMSGYNPLAFSQTLAFLSQAISGSDSRTATNTPAPAADGSTTTTTTDGTKGSRTRSLVYITWILLRFALAVDLGLLFELLGSFVLKQLKFKRVDFKTHTNSEAIVFIGCIGGLVAGVFLILIDLILRRQSQLNDTYTFRGTADGIRTTADGTAAPTTATQRPDRDAIMAGCILRTILWPALGALSGAVGTFFWHLAKHPKQSKHYGKQAATGALVQLVGAAMLQFILLGLMSLSFDKRQKQKKNTTATTT